VARSYRKKIGSRAYKNYDDVALNEALTKIAEGDLSMLAASKNIKYHMELYIINLMGNM
jgi:hypothetical protein